MATKTSKENTTPINVFNSIYFCFFLLFPFVYSDKIIDPVLIPRQIFLTLFLLIVIIIICNWLYTKKLSSDLSFLKLLLPLLLFLFLLITIVSFYQSIAITESIYALSKLIIEILFFVVTTNLIIQDKLNINILIKSIILFCFISVGLAIYQMFSIGFSGGNFLENIQLITSSFANKNLLSSILFLTLPFVVCGIFLSKQWKIVSITLLSIIILLLVAIQTKAVLIALVVSVLIFFGFIIGKRIVQPTFKFIVLFTSVILIVSFFVFQNKKYLPHLTNSRSAYTRLNLWDNSLQMAKENFMLGVGAGNWQIQFPKYGLNKFEEVEIKNGLTTFQRPHNDFLWVFCETGIIGITAYILIFIIALYYLLKLLKNADKKEDKSFYALFFATIIGYMLIAFVDFPLERIEHQVLLFLIFSIVVARYYSSIYIANTSKIAIGSFSAFILFVIPILFSAIVSFKRYVGEEHLHKMYNYHHQANWNQMIREADKGSNIFYSLDPMSAPIKWYKGVAFFTLGNVAEAENNFNQAYILNPYNIHVINNLASCYESQGNHKKAEEFYLKALSISPEFEEARLNLSAVYFNMKEYEKAFEIIDKCNYNTNNPKYYQTYLPVILNSWLDVLISKQMNNNMIKSLTDIKNSKTQIVQLYIDSKNKNIAFEKYLLKK